MTRPLHKLFILYEGELSPLLEDVNYRAKAANFGS